MRDPEVYAHERFRVQMSPLLTIAGCTATYSLEALTLHRLSENLHFSSLPPIPLLRIPWIILICFGVNQPIVLSKMCTVSRPKCKRAPTLTAWKLTPSGKLGLVTMSNMPIELTVCIKRLAAAIGTFCWFEFVNDLSVPQ